jgi:4-amino-4-deoxy-L-arabinose transferase-like glycosyltransferase
VELRATAGAPAGMPGPTGPFAACAARVTSLLPIPARRWPVLVMLVLMTGFAAACLGEAWLDSPTVDEPVYVAAGVLAAARHDLTYNEEHPPLPKALAALPVLADRPAIPAGWSRVRGHQEAGYAVRFTRAQVAAGKLRSVTFLSRLVPILEALAAGLVLYRLGALLYGPAAGAIAGVLWLASPLTMGLGHLDGVDLPVALGAALTSLALLRWLRRRDRGSVLLAGAAAGAAGAAGPAGLLLIAIAAGVVTGASWPGRRWRALVAGGAVALTAVAVIWASYAVLDPRVLLHPAPVLPRPYLNGLLFLKAHDSGPLPAYLLGRQWTGRQWWYWPGSLLVKMPLPALLILAAGPLAVWAASRPVRREALLVIALPALALTAFTLAVPPDTGIRYLLPAIALLLVAASGVAVIARGYAGRAVLAALLAATVVMAAASFPHSIAWTTPPFTPGYRFASGTSLDWGQDFYLLRRWSRGRHPYVVFHAAWGLGKVALRGARPLPATGAGRITGWVAVSASFLTAPRGDTPPSWLRSYCPVGTLGGSILIYRFRRPPRATAPGPARPAALCRGSRYSYLAAATAQRLAAAPPGRPAGTACVDMLISAVWYPVLQREGN